jgi:MFS family permease
VAVSLALFCVNTDFFALNLALPTIDKGFGVGARSVQWTISAYMLSVGSLFILAGRVSATLTASSGSARASSSKQRCLATRSPDGVSPA